MRLRRSLRSLALITLTAALAACGSDPGGDDGGPSVDAGPREDGGRPDGGGTDGSIMGMDGSIMGMDGSIMGMDGAITGMDGAAPPAPTCNAVEPIAASTAVATTLTAIGALLPDGTTVSLRPVDGGAPIELGAAVVSADGRSATVILGIGGAAEGFYGFVLVLPDGTELECGELRVTDTAPPSVTDVRPNSAYAGRPGDGVLSDRAVAVIGEGFQITPAVLFV